MTLRLFIRFWLISSCLPSTLFGQPDLAVDLPVATVASVRMDPSSGFVEQTDSAVLELYRSRSLAELLANRTGAYVKNYGPGTLSTLALRGGSSSQTAIVWNGIAVQSPMLGLSDLSLVPLWLIDEISTRQGDIGPSWGSGAIGGSIHLGTNSDNREGLAVSATGEFGSFGWSQQGIAISSGSGRLHLSTRVFRQSASNAFPYVVDPDPEPRKQENASQFQWGVLQRIDWKRSEREQISVDVWFQEADRSIPPLTTQSLSAATQQDAVIRTLAHWKRTTQRWQWDFRAGWFGEDIQYVDPTINLDATSSFRTLVAEAESQIQLTDCTIFSAGFQQRWTTASAEGYSEQHSQQRSTAFAFWRTTLQKLTVQTGIRQEWTNGSHAFFSPGLTSKWTPLGWLKISASINRVYRLPTLNDLFWTPGGQPDLLPEKGWSQEVSFRLMPSSGWSFDLSAYRRRISDWILWSPQGGGPIWTASNIAKVRTHGLSLRTRHNTHLNEWQMKFEAGGDYTRSVNEISLTLPRIESGQQLYYTPEWRLFASLTASHGPWVATYEHQYTGMVNAFAGTLPGFTIGHVNVRHNFTAKFCTGSLWLRIDNIWNRSYVIVERRPMPGRNFRIGMTIKAKTRKPVTSQ